MTPKQKRPRAILKKFALLRRAIVKYYGDNGAFLSSGIAFNILIAFIPFIMLLLAIVGAYFYNSQEVLNHIHAYFKDVAPALDPKITKSITDIVQSRHLVGVFGFIGLLWISTGVFGSLQTVLNIVFRVEKGRGVLPRIGIDLLMILLAGALLLVSMGLTSAVSAFQRFGGRFPLAIGPAFQWMLKYILPFVFSFSMFFCVYKIMPHRKIHYRPALLAALFSGLLWELAKQLFTWYVLHIARYSELYGSLNTLILFVLWVYYSSLVFVVGAELAYFLEE